jgi:phosphatidylinositol glycan class W
MDVGAGSFVVAAGLVSPRARGTGNILSGKAVQRMLPLLALGVVRLRTTKGLDDQEHVSEYGIHWNFSSPWLRCLRWQQLYHVDGNSQWGSWQCIN